VWGSAAEQLTDLAYAADLEPGDRRCRSGQHRAGRGVHPGERRHKQAPPPRVGGQHVWHVIREPFGEPSGHRHFVSKVLGRGLDEQVAGSSGDTLDV
jgi:hypothetical protein